MNRAVVIGGPTASGKSALALAVARTFDGVIINADSMQVYRDLPVLTAQPGAEERALAPHRLFGFLAATDSCSAARWAGLCRAEIAAALAGGRLPVVVGGTGLYLRALLQGLAPVPAIPEPVRMAARRRLAEIGNAAFHRELAERDPAMAARVRPGDSQRLLRAWEVMEATGRSLASWQQEAAPRLPADVVKLVLLPDRAALYAACDARFLSMIERGALEEARRLVGLADPSLPALKTLGLRELIGHLQGEMSLDQAIAAAQQATRRYAKRQMTWFRHQLPGARALPVEAPFGQYSESFLADICNFIRISS